jgi:hypothetical protein
VLPVSLNISKPVIGHPLDCGSVQPMEIEVLVVVIFVGTFTSVGLKQEYIVVTSLSSEAPFTFHATTLNLYGKLVVRP